MSKEDIMKVIDGVVYYHYDYTDYLYNIINKAIEYIEQHTIDFNTDELKTMGIPKMDFNCKDLLEILKGENE